MSFTYIHAIAHCVLIHDQQKLHETFRSFPVFVRLRFLLFVYFSDEDALITFLENTHTRYPFQATASALLATYFNTPSGDHSLSCRGYYFYPSGNRAAKNFWWCKHLCRLKVVSINWSFLFDRACGLSISYLTPLIVLPNWNVDIWRQNWVW